MFTRNRRRCLLLGLLAVAWLATGCQSEPKPDVSGDKKMNELTEMVLNKQARASTLAREIGPSANSKLIELAGHEDAQVRKIALNCLRQTGGTEAAEAMVKALLDGNSQVRAAALKGLFVHPEPSVYPDLLAAFDQSEHSYTRQQIAMVIGVMEKRADIAELRTRCAKIEDPEVIEGCTAALARLGDPDAQERFAAQMKASTETDRARYLEHCEYIHQPWVVKALEPVLVDTTPMVRIGMDGGPPHNEYLRACDIATNLIAEIAGAGFSFEVGGGANYEPDQLAEVREFVKNYKP